MTHFAELQVIKSNVRVLADNYCPPAPHYVAQHHAQSKLPQQPLHFFFYFLFLGFISKRRHVLLKVLFLSQAITLYKLFFQLLEIWRVLIECKKWWICNIIIKSELIKIIGNVKDGIIISGVLIIYKHILVILFFDEDIIGQKVIMREYQLIFFQWLNRFPQELYFLFRYPFVKLLQQFLLSLGVNVSRHLLPANSHQLRTTLKKYRLDQ